MKVYIVVQPQTLDKKPAIKDAYLDREKALEAAAKLDYGHVIEKKVIV